MDSSLDEFLKSSKSACIQGNNHSKIHVVVGNEACDLDSAVCAIAYAYCLNKVNSKPVIPVLNIPREDYRLRTEITYTLERFGIQADDLVFIDEIDLQTMKDRGELTVTLVDHNIIPAYQAFLEDAVVEIIDHHKEEIPLSPKYSKIIEPVGSCSTLVAEKILKVAPDILDDQVVTLLLAAILLDTVNLDPRAGRMTDKDARIVDELTKNLKTKLKCEELYLSVSRAKFDTSALTCMEILRKDFKAVPRNPKSHLSIGISSIGLSLKSFFTKNNVANDLREFIKLRGLRVLVVMAMYFDSMDGPPLRQIAAFGHDKEGVERLSQFLKDKKELDLVPIAPILHSCVCYDQQNVKASRKLVFPLVMEFLDS